VWLVVGLPQYVPAPTRIQTATQLSGRRSPHTSATRWVTAHVGDAGHGTLSVYQA